MFRVMVDHVGTSLQMRSVALVRRLDLDLNRIVLAWVGLASFFCGLRAAFPASQVQAAGIDLHALAPYVFVIGAPVAALLFTAALFPSGALHSQPQIRLARYGRWRTLDCVSARTLPFYGATGIMASLLLGMLINVPVRTGEFLVAVPALGADAPSWFRVLFYAMMADVTVMSSLYAVAFVMALRNVPSFPRFLVMVWMFDLLAQVSIAQAATHLVDLPPDIAAPLQSLLVGNLKKVGISLVLWLPYLLLSDRVNLTYRRRVRA